MQTTIPKSEGEAGRNPITGERTPLACRFRRLAEIFVPQVEHPEGESEVSLTKAWAGRPSPHAGRVRSLRMLRAVLPVLLCWFFPVEDALAFPPQITSQPTNQTVLVGSNATFVVGATTSNGLLSYQWYFQSTAIPGATNSSYTRTNAQLTNEGNYYVGVTNADGGLYSSNAILTVVNPIIVLDNTSRSSADGSLLSWPHAVGNGTNRILVVGVAIRGAGDTLTTVQYGGENMTLVGQAQNGSANMTVYMYRLLSPPIGTTNVTVTFSANERVSAGAISFTGVSQTAPLGPFAAAGGNSSFGSVTVASAANELVVDIMGTTGDALSLAPGAGQTAHWSTNTGTGGGEAMGASSTKSGAPATTISWTLGASKNWALGAVSLKPALPTIIAVDENSSFSTNGTTLSWPQSVGNGSKRMLMVGVTVNNRNAYTISSATYGGQNLTLVGSQDDGSGKVQVYLYRLLAPPVGTANVTFTISAANRMAGGAVSFSGVSQTEPLGTFASAAGNSSSASVNLSSATNEIVFDIMGTTGDAEPLTVGTNQVQRWNRATGTSGGEALGASSTKIGAGTVGMTWTMGANKVWAIGAVPIKPHLEPDVAATLTGPTSVFAGSNFTYTITVTNQGTATASNVVVSDILPAGLGVVSISGGGSIVAAGGLGQVVFDQSSSILHSNIVAGTRTWPHVTTNADNRLLLVGVSFGNTNLNSAVTVLTYGGVNLTRVLAKTNSNGYISSEVWQLVNPPSGSNTVSLTFAGSPSTLVAGAATFRGVDQLTPLSAINSRVGGKTSYAYVTLPSATNEIVFDTVTSEKPYLSSGQTQLWNNYGVESGGGSIKPGANFVTMGWALQNSYWIDLAVSVKAAGLIGHVTWTIPTLAPGATTNLTLTVTAPLSGPLSNAVSSTAETFDSNPANNDGSAVAAQVVTTVLPHADLVTTQSGLTSIAPLANYTYTVSVSNAGPTAASSVVVSDTLAPTLNYISSSGGGSYLAGVVTWPAFNLVRNATSNFTVTVRSPISGTVTNTASSTSPTGDPDAANNNGSAPEAQVITAVSPLQIANTSKGAAVQTLNWSHTVDPGSSRILIVGLSIDSTSATVNSATFAGFPTLTLIGQTNSGQTKVLMYRMLNPQVGTYPISISLSSAVGIVGGAASFNGVHQTTPIAAFAGNSGSGSNASLSVSSALGGVVINTLAPKSPRFATNAGPDQSVEWNLSGVNYSGAGGSSYGAATVTPSWELDSVANWAMAAVALNSATVLADVTLSASGPTSVTATSNLTYTITVTNLGASTASNVVVSDVLPAGATFVSASSGGTNNGGVVSWPTLTTFVNGARTNYTITIKAPANGTLTNIVYGTSITADPDPSNNNGAGSGNQIVTTIAPQADIATTVAGPASALAASQFNYTVTVSNAGPSFADNVVVSDTLPSTVSFVGASDGGTLNAGVVSWSLASLASGATSNFTVTVTAPASGTLSNMVAGTSGATDLVPSNNDGSSPAARVITSVTPVADIATTVTGPASVLAATPFSYTITVTNQGPSTAGDLLVSNTLPAAVQFVSASGGGSNNAGVVVWSIPTLASGETSNFTVNVTAPASGTLTNIIASSSSTSDPVPANNNGSAGDARVITTVTPVADIATTVTGPASVSAAAQFSYTVTVTNAGPSPAADVVVSDTLPAGTIFVSASAGGDQVAGVVTWSLATLASGATSNLIVTVTAPASGPLTNHVSSTSATTDPVPSDNDGSSPAAQVITTVVPPADITTTVTGPASVLTNATFSYTVTVANLGPSAATGVVVSDTLPAGVIFVGASSGGTQNAGVVTWPELASLASGAASNYTVTVTAPASGILTNRVSSVSGTSDPNSSNNDGSAPAAIVVTGIYPSALLTGRQLPGGDYQIEFQTFPNTPFSIETSTNLVDWVNLITTNSGDGQVIFINPDVPLYPWRFYRSRQ